MSKIALRIDRERLPRPGEAERSRRMLGQWTERARSLGGETAGAAEALLGHPTASPLLDAVFGSSPFLGAALTEMCVAHPAAGSFGLYAEMYLSPFAGYAVRMSYWLSQVVVTM